MVSAPTNADALRRLTDRVLPLDHLARSLVLEIESTHDTSLFGPLPAGAGAGAFGVFMD